jgi:poly(3-hydroxybutyrate) depolymerase
MGASREIALSQHDLLWIVDRPAYVYKPTVNKTTMPAIFVLHGSEAVAANMFDKGFEALAEKRGFLVVYPQMTIPYGYEWGYREDFPYFSTLLYRLQEDYSLDPNRTFVCGHSAGGSMALFLQNELERFTKGAAVEADVGRLHEWSMWKTGHPAMVIWNRADPELDYPNWGWYYYHRTIKILRRHGSKDYTMVKSLPTSSVIASAEYLLYPTEGNWSMDSDHGAPEVRVISFKSNPGTHKWANKTWATFDATEELVKFFLEDSYHVQTKASKGPGRASAAAATAVLVALMATITFGLILPACNQRRKGLSSSSHDPLVQGNGILVKARVPLLAP